MIKGYKVSDLIRGFFYFVMGNILGRIFYEKKYLKTKWFKSRGCGVMAPGWKWICVDFLGRKYNPGVPWPCSPHIRVGNYKNIHFDPEDINNFQGFGNYFQTLEDGNIYIGKGTWIAMNVGIITTNHNLRNPDIHQKSKDVVIGEHCWIGMNSMILPGVVLGNHTVVGAGSVVTKSFLNGNCLIAGNPARLIKQLDK
mgnify:CR=1 FL=1